MNASLATKSVLSLVAAGTAGFAVACGTGAAKSAAPAATNPPIVTAPTGADVQRAWQQFAACMTREMGLRVTLMPPPRYGIRIAGPGTGTTPTPAQQAAFEARTHRADAICHRFLAPIQKSSNSSQDEARFRDKALAFARCMRRHGVGVGDPIIRKVVGGFDLSFPPTPGVSTARWQRAAKACRSVNPIANG